MLVIPKEPGVLTWRELGWMAIRDFFNLVDDTVEFINQHFEPDGFNIGMNIGNCAGQTVEHMHMHVIPRWHGDVEDPVGGVRAVIPGRANYRTSKHYEGGPWLPDLSEFR
jgi:diadenosine tetraphosphate (Ap4A) HIT family hydrolase